MVKMDELISMIESHEAPGLPGYMDVEMTKRVESRVLSAIENIDYSDETIKTVNSNEMNTTVYHELSPFPLTENNCNKRKDRKKASRRRFLVFGIAAIMLLGLCLTVFGDSNPDWDVEILQFMGLDGTNTLQLDSGEVEIKVYDECEAIEYNAAGEKQPLAVKVLPTHSIGDKNSACIRIETDYKLPEGFNPESDYIIPEGYSVSVYKKDPAKYPASRIAMGSTFSYVENDGTLTFMLYITGCQGLNKAYVDITFENFYWYHDLNQDEEKNNLTSSEYENPQEELLLEGSWHLTWKYAYKSNIKSFVQIKPIQIDGVTYYLTNLEISPVSVQINGFRMPWVRQKDFDGFIVNQINYTDGTSLIIDNISGAGNNNGIWLDSFLGTTEIGEVIRTDQLDSIQISGNKIDLK